MHRALGMRLGPMSCPPRIMSSRLIGRGCVGDTSSASASLSTCQFQPRLVMSRCVPPTSPGHRRLSRGISSTAPVWKGRRGGASALTPKRSGPVRRKAPGVGKKKKPKVHGAPMSKINTEKRLAAESKLKFEALKALPTEEQNK